MLSQQEIARCNPLICETPCFFVGLTQINKLGHHCLASNLGVVVKKIESGNGPPCLD